MDTSPQYLDPKTLSELKDLSIRAATIVDGLVTGIHQSPFHGHSVEFAQHREYVSGDDIRHVDWQVFARTDKLHVKQFEDETNLCCWLLIDQSESMHFGGPGSPWSKYEYASCLAVALSWIVLNQRDAVGMGLFSDNCVRQGQESDQRESLPNIVEVLKMAEAKGSTSFRKSLNAFAAESVKRGIVVVLSDCFDEFDSIASGLESLRQKGHLVIVVQPLDPAELHFDFSQTLELSGMETDKTFLVDPITLKNAYQKVVKEKKDQLNDFCMKQNILFEQVSTVTNIAVIIRKIVQRIASFRSVSR